MRDVLGPGTILGYCTNVHAGAALEQTKANLEKYALEVKRRVSRDEPMGIGLWLSARAARELLESQGVAELRDWLDAHGLIPFTFNGFPYGDFHQPIVKHAVYRPDWRHRERLDYTIDLMDILADLLSEGAEGSISTLPVGWRGDIRSEEDIRAAAANFGLIAARAAAIEDRTGRLIHVDLEPEPGCFLQRSGDVAGFFERHLLTGDAPDLARRHLRVCHDVCHAAVMFESQHDALFGYEIAGVLIGKIQLSSGLRADFEPLQDAAGEQIVMELRRFREIRYLHQTVVQRPDGVTRAFYDDLSGALDAEATRRTPAGEWRVHFHVPVYLDRAGALGTTQGEIEMCMMLRERWPDLHHFEVETYAWEVLPAELRVDDLAGGIAREMQWVIDNFGQSKRAEGGA